MLNYSYCENGASVKVEDLRKLPISHLILIILNDKYGSISREFAEIELKLRIKIIIYKIRVHLIIFIIFNHTI